MSGCAAFDATDSNDAAPPLDAPSADAALVDAASDAQLPCVDGDLAMTDPATGRCYMFFDDQENWNNARALCESVGSRVTLAAITSAAEDDFVGTFITNDIWLGGNDIATEGQFVWITGEAFVFTDWRSGEPNNDGNEDCVVFEGTQGGTWDDRGCNNNLRYLCERP